MQKASAALDGGIGIGEMGEPGDGDAGDLEGGIVVVDGLFVFVVGGLLGLHLPGGRSAGLDAFLAGSVGRVLVDGDVAESAPGIDGR